VENKVPIPPRHKFTKDYNPFSQSSNDLPFELAERAQRLHAKILDLLIFAGLMTYFFTVAAPAISDDPQGDPNPLWLFVLFLPAIIWAGVNVYLLSRQGQTLGKKWVGIRIVRPNGQAASLLQLVILRTVVPFMLSTVGGLFTMADIAFIFRENRKCLHDEIAQTIVILAD